MVIGTGYKCFCKSKIIVPNNLYSVNVNMYLYIIFNVDYAVYFAGNKTNYETVITN